MATPLVLPTKIEPGQIWEVVDDSNCPFVPDNDEGDDGARYLKVGDKLIVDKYDCAGQYHIWWKVLVWNEPGFARADAILSYCKLL